MNRLQHFRWFILAAVAGMAASCGSLDHNEGSKGARFHEAASANVVVRFYGWNSIHVIRPDVRENGFLPLLNRETVADKFDQPEIGRGLAVVIFGYMFTKAEEANLVRDWNALFAEHGFRRVVLLRAGFKDDIDGLLILHDSAMTAAHDQPVKTADTIATLTTAAGADAAHSPVRSIR